MSVWVYVPFAKKKFTVLWTAHDYLLLCRVTDQLFGDYDDIMCAKTLEYSLALYNKVVFWESFPLFKQDGNDYAMCELNLAVCGPSGLYAYEKSYACDWRQWKIIKATMMRDQADSINVLCGRAVQLYNLFLNGKLPTLFSINELGDFQKVSDFSLKETL